jgi:hypothetical protein
MTTSEHDDPVEEERYEGREDDADPGAYIGRFPERAEETIPGGIGPDDERIAAHSTQGTGAGRPDVRGQPADAADAGDTPAGHRDGAPASDDDVRDAGLRR